MNLYVAQQGVKGGINFRDGQGEGGSCAQHQYSVL